MATFGRTTVAGATSTLSSDAMRGGKYTLAVAGYVTAIKAYLDGAGSGSGSQVVKAVIYADSSNYPGAQEGVSSQVTITAGQSAGWVTFAFSTPVYLAAGSYWLLIHSGTTSVVGRYYRDTSGGTLVSAISDTYSNGAADPCVSGGSVTSHYASIYAEYVVTPTITGLSVAQGPTAGGTSVVITGTNFVGVTAVKFGVTNAASYTVNSATQITATSPAYSAETTQVSVTATGGTTADTAADDFTFVAPAVVAGVDPNAGPTAGGTSVTIFGGNYIDVTAVTFGGTAASSYTVDSDTQITATAPAHVAGTVDVAVTALGGASANTISDNFMYGDAPAISLLLPSSGPAAGGTSVIIIGANFVDVTAVTFGGTNATSYTVDSATQITAVSPAHAAGAVRVQVTTALGTSADTSADDFTYVAGPTITGLNPNGGTTAGGTSVTITGTNLTGATAVTFGGTAASSYTVNSATQITATSPAHAVGTVQVQATTPDGASANTAADDYGYWTPDAPETFGKESIGASAQTVSANLQRGGLFTLAESGRVTAIKCYLDGNGGGAGFQVAKAVIYQNGSTYPTARKGISTEVIITAGQAAGWVEFAFAPAVFLSAGDYWLNLHAGTTTNVARYYRDNAGGMLVSSVSDTYSDGPATPCPGAGSVTSHAMSIYAEYTPAWHPITTAPTETTLDVIRVFKGMEQTYTDITSSTVEGFSGLGFSKVLNAPGGLDIELVASTVKQLLTWFDENSIVEHWAGGVRKGCYIVDDFTPNWGACTATVKCVGALSWATRALYDSSGAAIPTVDDALMAEFVTEGVNGAIGMTIWQYAAETIDIGSTSLDVAAGGSNCLDWLAGIAPLLGSYGARFWIDAAWIFHGALLLDPVAGTPDITYAMGGNCHEFATTYSARDIYNRVQILCPNAASPYFVVCDNAASQAIYGIRTAPAVEYVDAKSLAAGTTYGNNLLSGLAYPQLSMTLTVDHNDATEPGMLAAITGLEDGRTYTGIIQQITHNLGDLTDEVVVSYKPLTIGGVLA